jgi:hypothetical protein
MYDEPAVRVAWHLVHLCPVYTSTLEISSNDDDDDDDEVIGGD